MTFQEQFLVPRENITDLFSKYGLEVRKYKWANGVRPTRAIECTSGEIGTTGNSFGVYNTWFACITESKVSETKPVILMLGNGYAIEEVTNEDEFRKFLGLN